jgi:hypothetical protein
VPSSNNIDIYLEIGSKRMFAGALDWPGWCRSGRDEESALQALLDYAPRYKLVLLPAHIEFQPPADRSAFNVVERIQGDTTTDFGAPGKAPSADSKPVTDAELQRIQLILQACWAAFDAAAQKATGKELSKGPRGGGRELEKIIDHVLGADAGYLGQLGGGSKTAASNLSTVRRTILDTLATAAHGEIPAQGPRGGLRWTPRYFVRRSAWHVLDHAWEIEDRMM